MVQSRRSNDVASVLRRLALISLAPGASGQLLCSIFATGWFCLRAWCGSIISAAARTFSPLGEECHQTLHGPAAADTKGLWLCSLGKLPDGSCFGILVASRLVGQALDLENKAGRLNFTEGTSIPNLAK